MWPNTVVWYKKYNTICIYIYIYKRELYHSIAWCALYPHCSMVLVVLMQERGRCFLLARTWRTHSCPQCSRGWVTGWAQHKRRHQASRRNAHFESEIVLHRFAQTIAEAVILMLMRSYVQCMHWHDDKHAVGVCKALSPPPRSSMMHKCKLWSYACC